MAKKKLKMTKKCIAARRRYRAKKAGVPARRKRRGAGWGGLYKQLKKDQPSKPRRKPRMTPLTKMFDFGVDNRVFASLNSKMVAGVGAGFRKRRRKGRGRGRGRGRARGAGFWDDVGQTLINVGQTALQVLPLML